MRVFVAVVDQRSLSAAAASLGMSLPTVSRVLAGLEREIGARLLGRTNRGLTQTDCGLIYYRHCQQILAQMHYADALVQSQAKAAAGTLRVSAPVSFGRHHVAPHLAAFLERYPRLSCYLSLCDDFESLRERRLDVAIRIATLRGESLTARRLGYVRRSVVGSPEYFRRRMPPQCPRDLKRHECLHFTHYSRGDEWHFADGARNVAVRIMGRMQSNNQEALVDAVLAGAGLAVLPTWLVQEHLARGRLLRVLAEFELPRTPVYAVLAARGAAPRKVGAFIDFLAERYREQGVLAESSHR